MWSCKILRLRLWNGEQKDDSATEGLSKLPFCRKVALKTQNIASEIMKRRAKG